MMNKHWLYHNTGYLFSTLFAGICFYYAYKKLKKIRIFQDTPTSKVHAAAQGYLQLQGHGRQMPGTPILAPGSGMKCLWYEYKVEQLIVRDGQYRWEKILHQISDDCFYIKDQTGVCVVNPEKAQVIPTRTSVWYQRAQGGTAGWFTNGRQRHTETTLDVGTPLLVIGEFQTIRTADHDLTIEDEVGEIIRAWKQDYHQLLEKYDDNQDGEICPKEWENVLADAEKEVLKRRQNEQHTVGVHVIAHSKYKKPFVIAGKDEKALLKIFWWRFSGLCFLGSIVAYFPFMRGLRWLLQ